MPEKNQHGALVFHAEEFEADPDFIAQVLSCIKFFPFRTVYDDTTECFFTVGFSRRFAPLSFGEQAPEYKIVISEDYNPNKALDPDDIIVVNVEYLTEKQRNETIDEFHERTKEHIRDVNADKVLSKFDAKISH